MSVTETQSSSGQPEKFTGCVKWFNNKSGYWFITLLCDGSMNERDIFVHHSSLSVESEQYKYLVQGEYVEVTVDKSSDTKYEYTARHVTGIRCGRLMCEVRNEIRNSRPPRDASYAN